MLGKIHATAGFCLGVALSATASPAEAAIIIGETVLGSLAPDIDHKNSTISKKLRPVGFVASAVAGHRTLFHNAFVYAAAFATLWYFAKPTAVFLIPFFAGIASHLLLDALNPMGVPLLFGGRIHLANIHTGSKVEDILRWLLKVLCFAVLLWCALGQVHRLQGGVIDGLFG